MAEHSSAYRADIAGEIRPEATVPTNQPARTMLEAHEWDDVLGRLVGIQFRGTERIASSTILDALGVTQDKEARQKAGKRRLRAKVSGDTLAKLLEIIEAERRRRALEQKAAESLPRGRGGDDTPVPPEDAGEAS